MDQNIVDRAKFPDNSFPDFKGSHRIKFVTGENTVMNLTGAIWDTYGHPIYLVKDSEEYINFNNVISFRKET